MALVLPLQWSGFGLSRWQLDGSYPGPCRPGRGQCPLLMLFGPLRGSVRVLVHPRAVSQLREDQFFAGLACRKSEHGNDGRAVLIYLPASVDNARYGEDDVGCHRVKVRRNATAQEQSQVTTDSFCHRLQYVRLKAIVELPVFL